MYRSRGFTLVETVLVIIIAGLLAFTALPRFFNQDSFENRGFYTEVLNAVRYAQQLAVATNCDVKVELTSNTFTVYIWDGGACNAGTLSGAAPDPVTGQAGFTGSSTSATISPATDFQFNALGEASATTTVTVGGHSFTVHAATGYIEET